MKCECCGQNFDEVPWEVIQGKHVARCILCKLMGKLPPDFTPTHKDAA